MKKRVSIYGLILVITIIQIFGSIYYDQTPAFVWALSNSIQVLVPLVSGIRMGLLCLIPIAVSEIVWFGMLRTAGPLLHLLSFAVTVIILGFAGERLKGMSFSRRLIVSIILYELFLLAEEVLYYGLRVVFLHKAFRWDIISQTFLSWTNPALLILLGLFIFCDRSRRESSMCHFR